MNELENMSPEQRKVIEKFVDSFDINDYRKVSMFGSEAINKIGTFSQNLLNRAENSSNLEVDRLINEIVNEISGKNYQMEYETNWFLRLFFRRKPVKREPNYDLILRNIDKLVKELSAHQIDINMNYHLLDHQRQLNDESIEDISLYILCGKLIIERAKKKLETFSSSSKESDDSLKALEYSELVSSIERMQSKLIDLETSKIIALQMKPQISLLQDIDYKLLDKINNTIRTTIPLWKNQLLLIYAKENSKKLSSEQSLITGALNDILTNSSTSLEMMKGEVLEELERGEVTYQTLEETTKYLSERLREFIEAEKEQEKRLKDATKELKDQINQNNKKEEPIDDKTPIENSEQKLIL